MKQAGRAQYRSLTPRRRRRSQGRTGKETSFLSAAQAGRTRARTATQSFRRTTPRAEKQTPADADNTRSGRPRAAVTTYVVQGLDDFPSAFWLLQNESKQQRDESGALVLHVGSTTPVQCPFEMKANSRGTRTEPWCYMLGQPHLFSVRVTPFNHGTKVVQYCPRSAIIGWRRGGGGGPSLSTSMALEDSSCVQHLLRHKSRE